MEEYMPEELSRIIEMMNVAERYSYEELIEICMNVESSKQLCKNPELWERNMEIFRKNNKYSYTGMFSDSLWRKRTIFIGMILSNKNINPISFNRHFDTWLTEYGSVEIIQKLLDDERFDFLSHTIFIIENISGSSRDKTDIVTFLLSNDKVKDYLSKTASQEDFQTFLDQASMEGHLDIIEELLKYEEVDPSYDNNIPIINAASKGYLEVVNRLLQDHRVNPSDHNNEAIIRAASNGYLEIVNRLLQDSRVDPADQDNMAIKSAIKEGQIDIVNRLLQVLNFNISKYEIVLASASGDIDKVLEFLSDPDIDPFKYPENNNTHILFQAIRLALKNDHITIVTLILNDERSLKYNYSEIIIEAMRYNHIDIVRRLLDDPETDPSVRYNALLSISVSKGNLEIVDRLLRDKRLKSDRQHNIFDRILRSACRKGDLDIVNRLLEDKRFNPVRRRHNQDQDIVIIPAAVEGHVAIVERLLQDSRIISHLSIILKEIIVIGFNKNSQIILRMILKHPKADLSDNSIIINAAKWGNIDAINIMLEDYNEDVFISEDALKEAYNFGHVHIIERLLQYEQVINILTSEELKMYRKVSEY